MKLKILLINPWIHDFAAVNMWAKPLGLLHVAEYLSQFDIDMKLIDCTGVFHEKQYGTGHYPRKVINKPEVLKSIPRRYARYGFSIDEFRIKIRSELPCDLVLVTSLMSYWYPGVREAIGIIKSLYPDTPVILGGIYATLYHEHAVKVSGADYVYKGRVSHISGNVPQADNHGHVSGKPAKEEFLKDILKKFGFELKITNSSRPHYALGLYNHYPFAPVMTAYGCPYSCSYCASAILCEGFSQRDPFDVIREINDFSAMGVRDFAFYDDALLVGAETRLNIILREVIRSGKRVRFHCPNGIHARFINDETAYLMKRSGFTTVRLGLETVNEERQTATGGKTTSARLESAVMTLKRHGFTKKHIGVYLMYGLPGQELGETMEGIAFLKSLGVRIHLTEFSPIPGTSCWEDLKNKGVITDELDPLLTNNTVFSYLFSGYDPDAVGKLKLEVKEYNGIS